MFILNVIKIFFRNKWSEIKGFFSTKKWYALLEMLIIVGILIVVIPLGFGIGYVTGYVLINVLDWVDVTGETDTPLTIGFLFWCAIFIVWISGYGIYYFFKWTWTNIKIAIAEAKEM